MPEGFPGQPEALDQNQPTWEIYPSCDIRLGEYFRAFPEIFKGFVIDIDTDSIQNVLATLDTEHGPRSRQHTELYFEATALETLQKNKGGFWQYYTIGGLYTDGDHVSKKSESRFSRIVHAWQRRTSSKNIGKCAIGIGVQTLADKAIVASDVYSNHTPVSSALSQHTAVHELQHAIDYKNKYRPDKSLIYRWGNIVRSISARHIEKNIGSEAAAELRYQQYFNQPIEIRAREAEKQAHIFTPIISVHLRAGYDEYKQNANTELSTAE